MKSSSINSKKINHERTQNNNDTDPEEDYRGYGSSF